MSDLTFSGLSTRIRQPPTRPRHRASKPPCETGRKRLRAGKPATRASSASLAADAILRRDRQQGCSCHRSIQRASPSRREGSNVTAESPPARRIPMPDIRNDDAPRSAFGTSSELPLRNPVRRIPGAPRTSDRPLQARTLSDFGSCIGFSDASAATSVPATSIW